MSTFSIQFNLNMFIKVFFFLNFCLELELENQEKFWFFFNWTEKFKIQKIKLYLKTHYPTIKVLICWSKIFAFTPLASWPYLVAIFFSISEWYMLIWTITDIYWYNFCMQFSYSRGRGGDWVLNRHGEFVGIRFKWVR